MSSYKCFGPDLMTRSKVDKMLKQLYDQGLVDPGDLDNGCRDALMLLPEHLVRMLALAQAFRTGRRYHPSNSDPCPQAQHVVNEFSDAPLGSLRNVSAFFMSIVRRILKEAKKAQDIAAGLVPGASGTSGTASAAALSAAAAAAARRRSVDSMLHLSSTSAPTSPLLGRKARPGRPSNRAALAGGPKPAFLSPPPPRYRNRAGPWHVPRRAPLGRDLASG